MAEDAPHRLQKSRTRRWLIAAAGLLAAATLAGLVPPAIRLVEEEQCLRRLDDPDGEKREADIRRLGELRSARAAPRLVEIALDRTASETIEKLASEALVAIGPAAVESLVAALDPDSSSNGDLPLKIIAELGARSLRPLVEASRSADERRRRVAVWLLGEIAGIEPRALEAMLQALKDRSERARLDSVAALGKAKGRSAEIVIHLLSRIRDPAESERVRCSAAFCLPSLGNPGLEALRGGLHDEDGKVRAHIVDSLFFHRFDDDPEWLPRLEACLEDSDAEVRSIAVNRLSARHATPDAVQALLRILREQPEDRAAAATILERLGATARDAVPDLLAVLEEDDSNRSYILAALGGIGPDAAAATEKLAAHLDADPASPVELDAMRALGRIGPAARIAVPRLIGVLEEALDISELERVRVAAEGLGRIGPAALPAAPLLRRAVAMERRYVRGHALLALGRVGADDPESVAAMREGLRSELEVLRIFAALALLHLPGEEAEARRVLARIHGRELWFHDILEPLQGHPEETEALLPQLFSLLTIDGRELVKVCGLLGELGSRGVAALPVLERLHADQLAQNVDLSSREAVLTALRCLRAASD